MNVEEFRTYCLNFPYCSEVFPFDEVTLSFKIFDEKIFAILPLDTPDRANLKCDPEKAIVYREQYGAVQPGFHMNKKHWNTVFFNQDLSDEEIKKMIQHSYELVWNKLPLKLRKNGRTNR